MKLGRRKRWIRIGGTGERECGIDHLMMQVHSAGTSQLLSPHITKKRFNFNLFKEDFEEKQCYRRICLCKHMRGGLGESAELLWENLARLIRGGSQLLNDGGSVDIGCEGP